MHPSSQYPPHSPPPTKTSYLESIPLTISEDSTSKSDVNPFSNPSKKPETGLEQGKTIVSIQDSEASSRLSGSSMALIDEQEAGKLDASETGKKEVAAVHKSEDLQAEKDGVPIQESPPLFSPVKAPERDVFDYSSKHDLPRKEDTSKRGELPSDWAVLGVLGVLGVVLVGGVLWLRRAR